MTKAFQRELHDYVALHDPCSVDARLAALLWLQATRGPPLPFQAARRQGGARAQQVEILMVTTLHVPCLLQL